MAEHDRPDDTDGVAEGAQVVGAQLEREQVWLITEDRFRRRKSDLQFCNKFEHHYSTKVCELLAQLLVTSIFSSLGANSLVFPSTNSRMLVTGAVGASSNLLLR
jgi:hypothetical protein